jgi:clan AA aspartic protease
MGHVRVPVRFANPNEDQWVSVGAALVDTGATLTTIPRWIADEIRLKPVRREVMNTPTGEIVLEEASALIEYNGEKYPTPALISEDMDIVLIGVVTLETMALAVDPKTRRLIPSPMYLL